jgi:UMF1 family MFS transporter
LRKLSFALFDSGETVLSALIISTFFPLFITKHVEPKIYSLLLGLAFLASFFFALLLGRIADRRSLRKKFFSVFTLLTALMSAVIGLFYGKPFIALLSFLLMAVFHQQAFVFYNSLLLGFENKGGVSGFGVAMGYVGSAFALLVLAPLLKEPSLYYWVGGIFLLLSAPAILTLPDPEGNPSASLREVLADRRFLLFVTSVLMITEVANTLIAMMGVYLREVYGFADREIYRVIGLSALGGVAGGLFWGRLTDLLGPLRVFPLGFFIWSSSLFSLPFIPREWVLVVGFLFGVALSHLWTTARVFLLTHFPTETASIRLSFLSLTERIASTTGLTLWAFLLHLSGGNFPLSAGIMGVIPLFGAILYFCKVNPPRRLS